MDYGYYNQPKLAAAPTPKVGSSDKEPLNKKVSNYFKKEPSWPAIIFAILSVSAILYAIFAPRFSGNSRAAAIAVTVIWGILGTFLLWLLWKFEHRVAAWIILVVVLVLLLAFIMFMIGYNYGGLETLSIDNTSGFTRPSQF